MDTVFVQTVPSQSSTIIDLIKFILSLLGPIIGIVIGFILSRIHQSGEKKHEFHYRQINDLYSPLICCIIKIENIMSVQKELADYANEGWKNIHDKAPKPFFDHEKYFQPFKKLIEYDNRQQINEVIPLYREILDIFTNNYFLASNKSQVYYRDYLKFIEIWNRNLTEPFPDEVYEVIVENWPRIDLFFAHIKKEIAILTKAVSK
jgi:hypothetical protein